MKWLQLSTIDLKNGYGGVEFHARRLAIELEKLGVETHFSQDFLELSNPQWDVVQTHGSAIEISGGFLWNAFGFEARPAIRKLPIHIQTLHGTSLERLVACSEWLWMGGYWAAAREWLGVLHADLVLSGNPDTSFYRWARRMEKPGAVCMNGWDTPEDQTGNVSEFLPENLQVELDKLDEFWIFIGRGNDGVKGADLLKDALRQKGLLEKNFLVTVPGEGFEDTPGVLKTGHLSAAQMKTLMSQATGLFMPSRYEGYCIALAEALGQGLRVVATPVGAATLLSGPSHQNALGLYVASEISSQGLSQALHAAISDVKLDPMDQNRSVRAEANRKILFSWKDVARIAYEAVKNYQAMRRLK